MDEAPYSPEIVAAINDAFADDLCSTEAELAAAQGYYVEEFRRISQMVAASQTQSPWIDRVKSLFWRRS